MVALRVIENTSLFEKLPWPGNSNLSVFNSNRHLSTTYGGSFKLFFLMAGIKQGIPIFLVFGLIRPGTETEFFS